MVRKWSILQRWTMINKAQILYCNVMSLQFAIGLGQVVGMIQDVVPINTCTVANATYR